jgi:hypothetical protein
LFLPEEAIKRLSCDSWSNKFDFIIHK